MLMGEGHPILRLFAIVDDNIRDALAWTPRKSERFSSFEGCNVPREQSNSVMG